MKPVLHQFTLLLKSEGSLDRQLDLETYPADVLIGCSNPPQGEINLDWMGLYFYRLSWRAKYSKIIRFG